MPEANKKSRRGERYAWFIINNKWLIVFLSILIALPAISGIRHIHFNHDYKAFFSEDNPELNAFETIQNTYTKTDSVLISIFPEDNRDVFDRDVLAAIEELTEQSWLLPHALRADSVTNFQYTKAEGDDLIVRPLVEGAKDLSDEQRDHIKDIALNEPHLVNLLVNKSSKAAGVLVTFQMPGQSIDEMPQIADAAKAMIAKVQNTYPVDVRLTGSVMLNNAFFQSASKDAATLMPLMYLIIIVATFFIVRSLSATFGSIVVLLFSILTALGIGGWLGILLTPPSASAPTIITTLAIADSMHFILGMVVCLRKGMAKYEAIVESLRINLQPIFLTSLTTAIGFLTLNFSDAPPFRDMGNLTAIGVVAAFFYSVVLLPALLAILPMKQQTERKSGRFSMQSIADFVIKKRKPVLIVSLFVSVFFMALLPLNETNDDIIAYFDTSMEFRQDTDMTLDKLTGIYQIEFSLESGETYGVSSPNYLNNVERFAEWLRGQPEVIHVSSVTDTFKRINKSLHEDKQEWYRLPTDREQAAQYLLLYEMSLPFGLDLNNQIDLNKSATRLVATVNGMKTVQIIGFTDRAERWLKNNAGFDAIGTGAIVMFSHINKRNIDSMMEGTVIAILVISLIIMIALKSFNIGVISLIPNILPLALTFGIWALLDGEINVAASIVLSMALGIVVDDTVHFLSKYIRGRREHNYSAEQAVSYAFRHVGGAIIATSIILIAGFMLLAQSSFAHNSVMAQLTAIAVGVAVVADFLLLPALLISLDKKRNVTVVEPSLLQA